MKIFSKAILMSSAGLWAVPSFLCLSFNSAYASLTSINQNQAFESEPRAALSSMRPASPFTKLASVYFITGNDGLDFEGQEFKTDDVCVTAGYTFKGCPSGYIAVDPCPDDGSYYKNCIDKSTWCQNNGYNITSCQLPKYPTTPCPYDSSYYKTCETDNIRACKELGYSLTCETGKVGDTGDVCPYNSSYKKCICNPCTGYDYTASEATEQGYTMGESCNSCGTLKYKRTANACEGYLECKEGGASGAEVCYSGSVKKFSECKEVCDARFQYDSTNCTGGKVLGGETCGGKYESCTSPCGSEYAYEKSDSYLAWGEECDGKRQWTWDYSLTPWMFVSTQNTGCNTTCKEIPISFTYAGKTSNYTLKYFQPTAEQTNSPETVVTTCQELFTAISNPDIFNIKVNGHLACTQQGDYVPGVIERSDKHIYGSSREASSITFTDPQTQSHFAYQSFILCQNLILSNISLDISIGQGSPLLNVIGIPVLNNVDLHVKGDFDGELALASGQNNIYIDVPVYGYEYNETNTLIIDGNASLAVITNDKTKYNSLRYSDIYILGNHNSPSTYPNLWVGRLLYMKGNNKNFYDITLEKGNFVQFGRRSWGNYSFLAVLADNSTANAKTEKSVDNDAAAGNNSTLTLSYMNRIALGKNATIGSVKASSSYSGAYNNYTTDDYTVFSK